MFSQGLLTCNAAVPIQGVSSGDSAGGGACKDSSDTPSTGLLHLYGSLIRHAEDLMIAAGRAVSPYALRRVLVSQSLLPVPVPALT